MRILHDPPKRDANLERHRLDFESITEGFFDEAIVLAGKKGRFLAFGNLDGLAVAVVFKPLGSEDQPEARQQEGKASPVTSNAKGDARGYTDADMAEVSDNPEWTAEMFAAARPFAEVFPDLAASIRRGRGPQKAPTKTPVSLRLDQDVIDHFKAGGPGWQVRMGQALRKAAGLG